MSHYQTFPNATGSSKSVEKLRALRLPPLADKSFLDVGCNEGFFCGFAQHEGASHVVGIDKHQASVDQASNRFPDITFRSQTWDDPIEGQFDVILLASALHYASDQSALIHKLVSHLTPTGTLVLELGLAPNAGNQWVTVKRSIDERQFPSRAKLTEILDPFAWKLMGNSIEQAGDPIPRVVVHVQHKLPYVFLLMAPSGYGKSSISKLLGSAKDIKSVSGDALIHQVSLGKHNVSEKLRATVQKDYCHTNIAPIIDTLFDNNLGKEWVSLLLSNAVNQNIIIDAYIPRSRWEEVSDIVRDQGFAPINLVWDMIGPKLLDSNRYAERTESYVAQLSEMSPQNGIASEPIATRLINSIFKNTKQKTKQAYNLANLPADFIAEEYLRLHPDVLEAGMNPSYHYVCHGINEGRRYK